MATFGPPSRESGKKTRAAPPTFSSARLLVLQRALATLTHELGNMTSPVALVADAIAAGASPAQQASVAGTLRMIADSLRDSTAICRILRGNLTVGALSPATFRDATHWWTLCQPFVADMLPANARVQGTVAAATLAITQYEPLVWATLSAALFAGTTRTGLSELTVTGRTAGDDARTFVLTVSTVAQRATPAVRVARELKQLMEWESVRAGGRVTVSNTAARLDVRITIPPPPG